MFRNVPHTLSDARLGLLVILLIVAGGLITLYNAYRMYRLPWKPKGPANPRRVTLVVALGLILAMALIFILN